MQCHVLHHHLDSQKFVGGFYLNAKSRPVTALRWAQLKFYTVHKIFTNTYTMPYLVGTCLLIPTRALSHIKALAVLNHA
jgi:hypothetical protein